MSARLPNFCIIGAQKSGTTSLAYYLRAHPDVFLAPGKEVHYFNANFEKGTEWYKSRFAGAGKQKAVGDATPNYLAHPQAPARMAGVIPDAKLIAILREPVDRAYSHYWHSRFHGLESQEFAEVIAAGGKRRNGTPSYMERGRYLEQLQRFCQYYPREALLVLLFEDLRDAPLETFQKVCRFLDIADTVAPGNLGVVFNRGGSLWQRSSRFRKLAWYLPMLQKPINGGKEENPSYPPIDPALRAELQRQFVEDNAALAAWLGRNLSHWNSQPVAAG